VLDYAEGNQSRAAGILGINRGTLRKKLKSWACPERLSAPDADVVGPFAARYFPYPIKPASWSLRAPGKRNIEITLDGGRRSCSPTAA